MIKFEINSIKMDLFLILFWLKCQNLVVIIWKNIKKLFIKSKRWNRFKFLMHFVRVWVDQLHFKHFWINLTYFQLILNVLVKIVNILINLLILKMLSIIVMLMMFSLLLWRLFRIWKIRSFFKIIIRHWYLTKNYWKISTKT